MIEFYARNRWTIFFAAAAAVLYLSAYFRPMWGFYLFSPQYPRGLILSVYLNRVGGDVTEVNILNHYIGMAKLDQAAPLERALSVYGVGLIAAAALLFGWLRGRLSRWFALPALMFPVMFIAFLYFWMHRFGHQLSVEAPVHVPPFTPTLLGQGKIGNFRTIGLPGPGFYLSLAGLACVGLTAYARRWDARGATASGSARSCAPQPRPRSKGPSAIEARHR